MMNWLKNTPIVKPINTRTRFRLKKNKNSVRENYFIKKFNVGDDVSVTIYSDKPKLWYKGVVIETHTTARNTTYKVHFLNDTGNGLTYWFQESELRKWALVEEREERINQILND